MSPREVNLVNLPWTLRQLRKLPLPHRLGVLERLYGRSLERLGIGVVETACGVHWKLDLCNPTHRWIVYGDYEGQFVRWARKWLEEKPGVVIDSGANIGQTVLYLASIPGAKVFAFEPIESSRVWLQECLERYPDWDCEVIESGLSDKSGTIPMLEAGLDENHGEWSTMNTDWFEGKGFKEAEVPVTTIDQFLEKRGVDKVRLWKLDVEGWEDKVLRGAADSLRQKKVEALYVEVHPKNRDVVNSLLASAGYPVSGLPGRVSEKGSPKGECPGPASCLYMAT